VITVGELPDLPVLPLSRVCRYAPAAAIIPSQNPIENVIYKVPDLESKQRFSEDSEWSTLGALKMP
jgi:hypothetical protein